MIGSEIGFVPFWFLNDRLEESELRRQVREMAEAGIRGFFLHSRQGLGQPYLSEGFFRMIEVAIEEAELRGLEVNLYDEFPYPSGVAGGEVVLGKPELHATRLDHLVADIEGGEVSLALPPGKVLAVVAYPLEGGAVRWDHPRDLRENVGMALSRSSYIDLGLSPYSRKRFFASDPVPTLEATLPAGRYRLFAFAQVEVSDHKYWGHFADVLNPDAVSEFLKLTHERYAARFAGKLGSTIRSIFLDETAPLWSRLIPERFQRRVGYDLIPNLPALVDESHPAHAQVAADFARARYEMFCDAFETPISRWCSEHGIAYAGEKPAFRFSQLRFMEIPGCDPGHTKAGAPWDLIGPDLRKNAKAVASAAYLYGKRASLCECYHSLGWSATLQDARVIADALLLLGVDWIVPHGFFYSSAALRKHDAPPSFFFQMPYWPLWHLLSERVRRIAEQFAGSWVDARLLLLDPHGSLPGERERASYAALLKRLLERHVEFLVCDTDLLDPARCRNGRLLIRDLEIESILLPPIAAMEPPLAGRLAELERKGIGVVRVDDEDGIDEAIDALAPALRGGIEMEGAGIERFYSVSRTDGRRSIRFIMNTTTAPVELRIRSPLELREIPLDPECVPLLAREGGGDGYRRLLGPLEALLLSADLSRPTVSPEEREAAGPSASTGGAGSPQPRRAKAEAESRALLLPVVDLVLPSAARVEPRGANCLRMYRFRMSLCDDDGKPVQSARVRAVPLANQLDEGGFRVRPSIRHGFGRAAAITLPRLRLRYDYEFDCEHEGPVELVMEPGSLVGVWSITLNSTEAITDASFAPTERHIRGSLGVDVTSRLVSGRNRLCVELETDRADGGLLNCLYLFGDFGVDPRRPALVRRGSEGGFEDYLGNGLPYYAGVVDYSMAVRVASPPKDGRVTVRLLFPAPFEQACEISLNGSELIPVPWAPYRVSLPAEWLREGENDLTIRVATSLSRSFEGQYFDLARHATVDLPEP